MKTSTLLILAASFASITSCSGQNYSNQNYGNSQNQQTYGNGYSNGNQNNPYNGQNTNQVNQNGDNITMHPIVDSKTNMPLSQIPLPASWKTNTSGQQGAPTMTGPNGLEIYASGYRSFMYSNDPSTQQIYQSYGQQMRQPAGIENVISQDLMPMAQERGLRIDRQYPLPQVAQNDKSYMDQLYSVGPKNDRFQAAGIECTDKNGKKVFIVLHYNEMASSGMVNWGYYLQSLGAETAYFETAKSAYINGLANTQYNPQAIAAYNRSESSKATNSWIENEKRLGDKQAAFDAQQRTHRETYDAINKSSMDAYNNNNGSMDRNQHAFTNYINGENTVTDPANGQSYQVESNSAQYWMNGNGEYIKSDNSLYDPNLDPNTNNQTWQQAPENPYGK